MVCLIQQFGNWVRSTRKFYSGVGDIAAVSHHYLRQTRRSEVVNLTTSLGCFVVCLRVGSGHRLGFPEGLPLAGCGISGDQRVSRIIIRHLRSLHDARAAGEARRSASRKTAQPCLRIFHKLHVRIRA